MLEPIARKDWNETQAAHLLARAGFGATPAEITAAAKRDPADVVRDLLAFDEKTLPADTPGFTKEKDAELRPERRFPLKGLSEEERKKRQQEMRREEMEHLRQLRAWWLNQMRTTKFPLQEKLALFWHGHWASSAEKVRSAYAMWVQNQTFRRLAAGNFKTMTVALSQDPAMLVYLDNAQSRAAHPNENYARELMELFALGIGNYTEDDIKNSARAFTGWTIHPEKVQFSERKSMHDDGEKTFMGRTGKFTGRDIIDIILEQPAAAPYIARKLWVFFGSENPDPKLVDALAGLLKENNWDLKPMLERMFLSREFHDRKVVRSQIKSPVQWLVGTGRNLDAPLPDVDVCTGILHQLGQDLFGPPSVKGWDGGYAWITTNSLFNRYNFAGVLVKGGSVLNEIPGMEAMRKGKEPGAKSMGPMARIVRAMAVAQPVIDPEALLPADARKDKETALKHLEWTLYRTQLSSAENKELRESLGRMPAPAQWKADDVRTIVHTMMASPHYQLT